jgi:hypothetical protein
VRRSENNTHPIVESDTVDATAAVSHPVGNVPAVVNINSEGTIYCTQLLYWVGGGCGVECRWPVCSQV